MNKISLCFTLGLLVSGSSFAADLKQGQSQIYCVQDKTTEKAVQLINDQIMFAKDGKIGIPILDGPAKGTNVMVSAPYEVSAPNVSFANGHYFACVTISKK